MYTDADVVACGAGPASEIEVLMRLAHDREWRVATVATSAAMDFLDVAALKSLTSNPIRSAYAIPSMVEIGRRQESGRWW